MIRIKASFLTGLLFACTAEEQTPSPPAGQVYFSEIASEAGLTLQNVCGSPEKRYIVDAKGGSLDAVSYTHLTLPTKA